MKDPRRPPVPHGGIGGLFFFLRLDTDCDDMIQYADMKRTIGENGGGTE